MNEDCICPRFSDTGGFRVSDLCCSIHGVNGSDPGDGYWEDEKSIINSEYFYCESCDVSTPMDCICYEDDVDYENEKVVRVPKPLETDENGNPINHYTYRALVAEVERRRRESEDFKTKIKSIGFPQVPGGVRTEK